MTAMRRYSGTDIHAFEVEHETRIPPRLARFLEARGAGQYGEIEIHELDDIGTRYEPFFDDPHELFARYLPFACNERTQELWVLDVTVPDTAFAKIWHETVPDDWAEEEWQPFDQCRDAELLSLGL